jgi:hypothetical protein
MGSSLAHFRVGWVFANRTNRTVEDHERAIAAFNRAADLGEDASFGEIARILDFRKRRQEATEYWDRYFSGRTFNSTDQLDPLVESNRIENTIQYLLGISRTDATLANLKYKERLTPFKKELLEKLKSDQPYWYLKLSPRLDEIL